MSYSLYIWHYLLLLALPWHDQLVDVPLLLGASLLVAWMSYRYVEVPLRQRLSGRPRHGPVPIAVPA